MEEVIPIRGAAVAVLAAQAAVQMARQMVAWDTNAAFQEHQRIMRVVAAALAEPLVQVAVRTARLRVEIPMRLMQPQIPVAVVAVPITHFQVGEDTTSESTPICKSDLGRVG